MLPRSEQFVYGCDLTLGKKLNYPHNLINFLKENTLFFIYLFKFLETSGPKLEAPTEAILETAIFSTFFFLQRSSCPSYYFQ